MKKALIIGNGDPISKERLSQFATECFIVVLDGAFDFAQTTLLPIDILLGDFDSIVPHALAVARLKGIEVVRADNQHFTDLEKAIHFLYERGYADITIACVTGLRMDHTLHNIRILNRYHQSNGTLRIVTASETLFLLKDSQLDYYGKVGDRIALLGAPDATVTTQGLRYNMNAYLLSYTGNSSVCNHFEKNQVTLHVKGTALVIHEDQPLS